MPGGFIIGASPHRIRNQDSVHWKLKNGFRLPTTRSLLPLARDDLFLASRPSPLDTPPDPTGTLSTETSTGTDQCSLIGKPRTWSEQEFLETQSETMWPNGKSPCQSEKGKPIMYIKEVVWYFAALERNAAPTAGTRSHGRKTSHYSPKECHELS